MAKRKRVRIAWWATNPLWKIRFPTNHLFRVGTVINRLPPLPFDEKNQVPRWQWEILNPDFSYWIGLSIFSVDPKALILNVVKPFRESINENRKAILQMRAPRGSSRGWRVRCIGTVEWMASLFPLNHGDDQLFYAFLWTTRDHWHYAQALDAFQQLNQCWIELAATKRIRGEAPVTRDEGPHQTVQAAYEFIVANPGARWIGNSQAYRSYPRAF
jgi:hypothetical protein